MNDSAPYGKAENVLASLQIIVPLKYYSLTFRIMHPFLNEDFHIHWSKLTADRVEPDISKALSDAQAAVDQVANQAEPLNY